MSKTIIVCGEKCLFDDDFTPMCCMKIVKGYVMLQKYIGKNKNGNCKSKYVSAHRVIIKAKDGQIVDHINHDKLDNRRKNLRITTTVGNSCNRKRIVGCTFHHGCKKWQAIVTYNGVHYYCGVYKNKNDAIAARNAKAKELSPMFTMAKIQQGRRCK